MWKWKWGSSSAAGGILNMHDLEFLFYLVDCNDCPSPLDSTRFGSAKYEEKKKTKKERKKDIELIALMIDRHSPPLLLLFFLPSFLFLFFFSVTADVNEAMP